MSTQSHKQSQKEFKISKKETNFQQSMRVISNKTPLISTNLESNQLPEHHNQDSKAREILEFNHLSKLDLKYNLKEATKTKLDIWTNKQRSNQANRTSNLTQDNHQQIEREATKDLQSTQEVPMFMLIKTRCTTVNINTKLQVTKKMPQQTFHQDHKSGEISSSIILSNITKTESTSHTLHKLVSEKPVI